MKPDVERDEDEEFLSLGLRLGFLEAATHEALSSEVTRSRETGDPARARDLSARQGRLTPAHIDIMEMLLRPTQAIPGYELLDHLGHGGMGVVFQARQLNLDRVVALKTILVSGLGHSDALLRFEREARAIAKLQHPNIVAAYDFGQHAGRLFLAMEFLKGTDVDRWIDSEGPLPESVVWSLARQAVAGLAHAAHAGIIHRDIKPANMLLVDPPEGSNLPPGIPLLKLADFGLARLGGDLEVSSRVTRPNAAVGSPHYMAPEQLQGGDIDSRADLYALGASVYHMLTGRPPFDVDNLTQIISMKISTGPKPLQAVAPGFHPQTYQLVESLMELSPERRPSDFAVILRRIDGLLGELPPLEVHEGLWSTTRALPRGESETIDQTIVFSTTGVSPTATQSTRPFLAQPVASPSLAPVRRRMGAGWIAGAVLVTLILGSVILWQANHNIRAPEIVRIAMKDDGYAKRLFNGTDLQDWNRRSGAWVSPPGSATMEGTDGVIEKILMNAGSQPGQRVPVENYRLQFFVDPQSAPAVELHFGFDYVSNRDGLRWVLRLTKDQFQIGECETDAGELIAIGPPVAVTQSLADPYTVTLEQQPAGWFVTVNNKPSAAVPRRERELSEIRFRVQGGPAVFSDIELTQLRPATPASQ